MPDTQLFDIHPHVTAALAQNRPVVALESTIIAHGLPRPLNLEVARQCETVVREAATPATIAVLKGRICVGLDDVRLKHIATSGDVHKLSLRDLPIAVARGWDGATTVAATCWIAERAGLQVFATGGIGGVHRGSLPDVSADLPALARARMVVVCAGAKVVLDLPATREWLETHGVTVVGYGCDEMPAFYTRTSGLPVDVRVDTPAEVVGLVVARRQLDLPGALLVTVPVPVESEVPAAQMEALLAEALDEATRQEIGGRELTPFLLARLSERSDGVTVKANLDLIRQNIRVAAGIAQALSALPPPVLHV
ncbi:MAG: pseudouridine-5'-phosphate glycosidase [Pyrinomonadaceae bacterium]